MILVSLSYLTDYTESSSPSANLVLVTISACVRPSLVQLPSVGSIMHTQQPSEKLEPLWELTFSQSSKRMPPMRFALARTHSSFLAPSASSVLHWQFSFSQILTRLDPSFQITTNLTHNFGSRTLSPLKMLASASILPKMATIPQLWAPQDTASVLMKSNQRAQDFRCCTSFTSRTHHYALRPCPINVASSLLTRATRIRTPTRQTQIVTGL